MVQWRNLADALDSKSSVEIYVRVRFPLGLQINLKFMKTYKKLLTIILN